jgi:PAS domain S-box-containing protein
VSTSELPVALPDDAPRAERNCTVNSQVSPEELLEAIFSGLEALGVGFELKRPAQLPEYESSFLRQNFGSECQSECFHRYLGKNEACRPCLLARAIAAKSVQRSTLKGVDGRYFDITAIPQIGQHQGSGWAMEILQDVTERMRAEQALRASEERFRAIAENSVDVIMRFDRQHRHLYVNPVVKDQTGIDASEFFGKSHAELGFPAELCRIWDTEIDAVFASGQTRRVQFQLPMGTWIDWMLMAERGDDGETNAVLTSARDITSLKRSEEQLRQRESMLEEAQALANAGDFYWDPSEHLLVWSKQLYRIFGLDPNSVTPEESVFWSEVLPLSDDVIAQHLARARETCEPTHFERRIQRLDGGQRILLVTVCWRRNDAGQPATLSGSIQDVTDQTLAEAALRKSEEMYRAIADNVGDGIWLVDIASLRFTYTSPAVVQASGYDQDELRELRVDQLMTAESAARVRAELNDALVQSKTCKKVMRRLEVEELCKSGQVRWVEVTARLLVDDQGQPREIIGVTHDVTDRRRAHELLAKAKAHAEETNRLKSRFVSNVSHEIRTPLNAIIGLVELILRDKDLSSAQANAATVLHESELLLSLVNDLLDHAKMEEGKFELSPEPTDLDELLAAVGRNGALLADRKGLAFQVAVAATVPKNLVCDPLRLRQILQNLVANAVKFTERGGVKLEITCPEQSETQARLVFSVTDTGIGIAEERQEAIFDAFVQADQNTTRRFGGTGLGTTIARQLVHLMGGKIGLESTPNKGSRFWFELPLELGNSSPDSHRSLPSGLDSMRMSGQQRAGSILVAEDYPVNQRILREHLESAGHHVTVVENGQEAYRACELQRFDLVLMDLQMPIMDGFEATCLIRTLREPNGSVPVLAVTASAEASTRRECVDRGMNGVITKPVRRRSLLDTVDSWLLHSEGAISTPMPPSIGVSAAAVDTALVLQRTEFDYQSLIEQFGGNAALARSVAKDFASTLEREKDSLVGLFASGNLEEVRRIAHRVKGGAATIGASTAAGIAEQIETAARDNVPAVLPKLLDMLRDAQVKLRELVSAKCEKGVR